MIRPALEMFLEQGGYARRGEDAARLGALRGETLEHLFAESVQQPAREGDVEATLATTQHLVRETAGGGTIDARTFYDGLGRAIMSRAEGEAPGQIVDLADEWPVDFTDKVETALLAM